MTPNFTRFSSLPSELRIHIYELVLGNRSPRIVTVEVCDDTVYPKSRPPALLHVNQESRAVVLKIYKPWLPQFAGSAAHAPYAALLAKYRPAKSRGKNAISCLDFVCFDLDRDTLFCRSRLPPSGLFGRIEELCLKKLAVNIDGFVNFPKLVANLKGAKNLETLILFQDTYSDGMDYKGMRIHDGLVTISERDRAKPKMRVPNYVAPLIHITTTSRIIPSYSSVTQPSTRGRRTLPVPICPIGPKLPKPLATWTRYKFPGGQSGIPVPLSKYPPSNPTPKSRARKRKSQTSPMENSSESCGLSHRIKRVRMDIRVQEHMRKRVEARSRLKSVSSVQERHLAKTRCSTEVANIYRKPVTSGTDSEIPCQGYDSDTSRAASSVDNEWAGMRSDSEQIGLQSVGGSTRSRQLSESPSPRKRCESVGDTSFAIDESVRSKRGDSELSSSKLGVSRSESPDPQAFIDMHPKIFHAYRYNSDSGVTEILVEFDEQPRMDSWCWILESDLLVEIPDIVADFLSTRDALDDGTPVQLHQRRHNNNAYDFLVEFDGYPEEIYWTWVPEEQIQKRAPCLTTAWQSGDSSDYETCDSAEVEITNNKTEENDTTKVKPEETDDDEMYESATEWLQEQYPVHYTLKRFVAQRETPGGSEILVEWEDYPNEEDWTWEPEDNLLEDNPQMVTAWRAMNTTVPETAANVYEVEAILEERKIKGVWHFLVKWKGYSKDKSRTWEPCKKLGVDVPELVEAFQLKKQKRRILKTRRTRKATA